MSQNSDRSKKSAEQPQIDEENFCYFPFLQLLLQPTGVVSPCCWNQEVVLGQVPQQKIEEIWNGEAMQKLRKEFLEGKPVSCATQIRHIKCHKWSRRDYQKELELAEIISTGPRRLDVRLNGKCNLQCVMCDVWKQPNGTYDKSDFWTKGPENIFPFLREVDVLGGEPFVQADTFRLLDEVWKVNKDCTWAFVTNGNYKFGPPIRSRLDRANLRWMQISLDSVVEETYSKIRVGGSLDKVMKTISDLRQYRDERERDKRPFGFLISMCVQQHNWREVDKFINFAVENGIDMVLQFAYQPDKASLMYLPEEKRREVAKYFGALRKLYNPSMIDPVYLPIVESLPAPKERPLEA